MEVYNDSSGFELDPLPSHEEIATIRLKLDPCGFTDWFKEAKDILK